MTIGLHAHSAHRIPAASLRSVVDQTIRAGHQVLVSDVLLKTLEQNLRNQVSGTFSSEQDAANLDALLSLGGDGTLLESLLYTLRKRIPLLGINFGRLGFLPSIPDTELGNLLIEFSEGRMLVQERSVLELECESSVHPFPEFPFALNEVAIIKKDSSSMIHIRTEVDGLFLNEYWGDGLIVASPTGSTGYSLSCGGPILWPDSSAIVLTPVSPHNLSMRPLVLNDGMQISLIPGGRSSKIMLSMDSRSRSFPVNQRIKVKKSKESARFILHSKDAFPSTLREKLFWGKDYRN